jgi:predicted dehydrogenase
LTVRVGIISANWGAFAHLPAWRAVPGVEVVAICTSRQQTAEAAAKRCGIARPYWDAEQMIAESDIDIIDCGTRPSIRHSMVLSALRAGKHVYNAIPCAADFERARALHGAWKASGKVAVVDAFSQWLPAHRLAKELIDQGALGELFAGACTFNLSLFNAPNPHFPYNWFSQAGQGVSALRNLGSHALHMLVHMFGEIEELVAVDDQLLSEWRFADGAIIKPETNDFAMLMLRFKSGMRMQMQVSWNATVAPGWTIEAFGSKGRFLATAPNFPTGRDTILRFGALGGAGLEPMEIPERLMREPGIALSARDDPQPSFPMALSVRRMLAAIAGEGAASPDFEQAWAVERALEAARRSSSERRWVRLREIA